MRKIIHHLRNKPEHERKDILHVCTVFFAILLFLFWAYSLGKNFSDPITQKKIENDLKPFSVLKDNMVGGYQNTSNSNLEVIGETQ